MSAELTFKDAGEILKATVLLISAIKKNYPKAGADAIKLVAENAVAITLGDS